MGGLFSLLFFISLLVLILGLIKPSIISKLLKKELSRKKIGLLFGILTLAFLILASLATDTSSTAKPAKTENIQVTTNQVKEKTYQQITAFSGSGSKNSEPFTIEGDRVKIKYECTGIPCYAKLRPVQKRPGFLWKDIFNTDRSTKDETIIYEKGQFYIEVVSSDTFSMTVEDYK